MASAYRRKGRSFCYLEYKDQHGVTRKNLPTQIKDRTVARQLADKIEADAAHLRAGLLPQHPDVTGPYLKLYMAGRTWKEFREEYRVRALDGQAEATRKLAQECLDRFERLMKPAAVCEVTAQTVADFVVALRRQRGRKKGETASPATVNKNLRHLKAALRMAHEWQYLAQVPRSASRRSRRSCPATSPRSATRRSTGAARRPGCRRGRATRPPPGGRRWRSSST
jgi:hypothetical protein